MEQQWPLYALIFAAVFLAVQGTRGMIVSRNEARRISNRFGSIDPFSQNRAEVELLKQRGRRTTDAGPIGALRRLIVQSGLNVSIPKLGMYWAGIFLAVFLLSRSIGSTLAVVIAFAVSTLLLFFFLRRKRSRRISKFGEQLPDLLEIIVRSLRAGHPLPVALSLVGREMPSPAGPEFTVVFDEISYGREVRAALENLHERVGHPDLKFLITSIAIAHQTGGNLGEILGRLSKLLRERFRMRRKIKALSAEGRVGGYIMSVLPFVIFGSISITQPGYYGEFWGQPGQNTAFVVAMVLLAIGNFVIHRMVNFKV